MDISSRANEINLDIVIISFVMDPSLHDMILEGLWTCNAGWHNQRLLTMSLLWILSSFPKYTP